MNPPAHLQALMGSIGINAVLAVVLMQGIAATPASAAGSLGLDVSASAGTAVHTCAPPERRHLGGSARQILTVLLALVV